MDKKTNQINFKDFENEQFDIVYNTFLWNVAKCYSYSFNNLYREYKNKKNAQSK